MAESWAGVFVILKVLESKAPPPNELLLNGSLEDPFWLVGVGLEGWWPSELISGRPPFLWDGVGGIEEPRITPVLPGSCGRASIGSGVF